MPKALSLVGKRFGKLVVTARVENDHHGQTMWAATCDCGNRGEYNGSRLSIGKTRSCGCLVSETTVARSTKHGQANRAKQTRAYRAWKEMNRRVNRDPHYLAKGISVCPEWVQSYETFYRDMGDCPDGYELDRKDNSKGYDASNCQWVSETHQSRNRTYCKLDMEKAAQIRADTRPQKEIAKDYGVSVSAVQRIKYNKAWV